MDAFLLNFHITNPLPYYYCRYAEAPFVVAIQVVEAVTGKTWHEVFAEELGTPLGLNATCRWEWPSRALVDGGSGLAFAQDTVSPATLTSTLAGFLNVQAPL